MKERRAAEIAEKLSDNTYWHSHGRGVNMKALKEHVGLRIEDMSDQNDLAVLVREYFGLLRDYMNQKNLVSFVHNKKYF
jgi:hypothetical protein